MSGWRDVDSACSNGERYVAECVRVIQPFRLHIAAIQELQLQITGLPLRMHVFSITAHGFQKATHHTLARGSFAIGCESLREEQRV